MSFEQSFSVIFVLVPLALGILFKSRPVSFSNLRSLVLATIGTLGAGLILMQLAFAPDPAILFLAGVLLLSAFCAVLGQGAGPNGSEVCTSILIVLGLGLGAVLHPDMLGRMFLAGLLGYVVVSVNPAKRSSFREKAVFTHIGAAILLTLSSGFMGSAWSALAGLFLAVTFLPLVPFHLPLVSVVENAKGTLSSFWIVLWLIIGMVELYRLHPFLTTGMLEVIGPLALFSAAVASLACLGHQKSNRFVASAAVAHVALVWGLLDVFSGFSRWAIPFGTAVALVMGGVSLAFSFVHWRFGWQPIGKLPGLASPMPRFGIVMVLLVSFAMFLPLFSMFSGMKLMPDAAVRDVGIITVLFTFLVVWLGGGWCFLQMLHQTAFGSARSDVPYTDLRAAEFSAVSALIACAAYSGMIL